MIKPNNKEKERFFEKLGLVAFLVCLGIAFNISQIQTKCPTMNDIEYIIFGILLIIAIMLAMLLYLFPLGFKILKK